MDDDRGQADHAVDAIAAGARYELTTYQERAELLEAILQATEQFEAVWSLVRSSDSAEALVSGLAELLGLSETASRVVADMQLKTAAPYRHRRVAAEFEECAATIADLRSILASPERLSELVGTERGDHLAARRPRDP